MSDKNLTNSILISSNYIYLIQLSFGILFIPFTFFITKRYTLDLSLVNHFFFNLLFLGTILTYLFLETNQRFRADQSRKVKGRVIEYRKAGSRTQRHAGVNVIIDIENLHKKIWFPYGVKMQDVEEIELTIAEGYWGYDVIIDQKIIR